MEQHELQTFGDLVCAVDVIAAQENAVLQVDCAFKVKLFLQ